MRTWFATSKVASVRTCVVHEYVVSRISSSRPHLAAGGARFRICTGVARHGGDGASVAACARACRDYNTTSDSALGRAAANLHLRTDQRRGHARRDVDAAGLALGAVATLD